MAAIGLGVLAIIVALVTYLIVAVVAWITAHIAILAGIAVLILAVTAGGGSRICKTVVTVVHRH